jgi:hypothetical protein
LIIHRDLHFVKGVSMNNRTRVAVERQITAMGADVFEVGLFKPRVPGDPSHEPEMLPRVWDRETLLRSVSWLSYQNANGRNIYVRPKGEHHLSLVDDLTAAAVQKMKGEGFTPALVVETSPGNFQAWLNHGQVLQKQLSTLAARTLAERFGGDKGAADWRHFGRLAGLTNRKPKHRAEDGENSCSSVGAAKIEEQWPYRSSANSSRTWKNCPPSRA